MELLQSELVFGRDGVEWQCQLFLINFKKLLSIEGGNITLCEVITDYSFY